MANNIPTAPTFDNLVDYILHHCTPWPGAETAHSLFSTYGYNYYGIGDGYSWFTTRTGLPLYQGTAITDLARAHGHKPLEEATEAELWQLIAMCSTYWLRKYQEWHEENQADLAESQHENEELKKNLKKLGAKEESDG